MTTPNDDPTMETSNVDVSDDNPMLVTRILPKGVVSAKFEVTRDLRRIVMENAKVNIGKLYMRQISAGPDANQSDVIQPNAKTGLGKTVANNWAIYDGHSSKAKLVAKTHGMHTLAGKWNNWFTMVFEDERFEGSTLQIMGANDDDEENEWAIVGGTGEFAMARGIIERRVYSAIGSRLTQELNIEFFCRMKEVVPDVPKALAAPAKRGPWGENRGTLHEIEGKSQRLESVTIKYLSWGVVHAIGFSYVDEDGGIRTTGMWGHMTQDSGSDPMETFKFGPSEFVKQITGLVTGKQYYYLSKLQIVTNHRTYGPFGGYDGTPFSYTVPDDETVVGFFAKTDDYISMIGVYTIPK